MVLEKPLSPVPSPQLFLCTKDPGGSLNQVNRQKLARRGALSQLGNGKENSAPSSLALIDQAACLSGSVQAKDKKALSTDVHKAVECFRGLPYSIGG